MKSLTSAAILLEDVVELDVADAELDVDTDVDVDEEDELVVLEVFVEEDEVVVTTEVDEVSVGEATEPSSIELTMFRTMITYM